ncbi:ATP-binding protein [Acidaminococcus fermentans]|uniref:ATP-binding protein n=1 Tax=Acidaminococcus fermentans TaxID=905 RepID=UPI002E774830|nr:ATP-binding protein [Acidaminococcus fermentans]MEE0338162.1 ATP-binding protein [Acidaminococcus fermentans]
MKLLDIHLKEGLLFQKDVHFTPNVNIIHSKNNSSGKTTLLRFILYALGYQIPSTQKISFEECDVELVIQDSKGQKVNIVRVRNAVEVNQNNTLTTFPLPGKENELHMMLFNCTNTNILKNLLGAFYVDQEKGWTLLNRGVVIGSIHFSIEELLYGLGDLKYDTLEKIQKLADEIKRYKNIHSISLYRDQVTQNIGLLPVDNFEEKTNAKLDALIVQKNGFEEELKRIDSSLSNNKKIKKFINDMRLIVKSKDGKEIQVTDQNIVGLNDSIEYLRTRKKYITGELNKVLSTIEVISKVMNVENEKLEVLEELPTVSALNKSLARIPLDSVAIEDKLKKLSKLKRQLNDQSKNALSMNPYTSLLARTFLRYANELGVKTEDMSEAYIFTSNLKELTGAVLHKLAFAFRLAYITAIEKKLGEQFPIILDSPYGKEIDKENVDQMMQILQRDFSDHQIIIASIYTYDFPNANIIELGKKLFE